MVIKDARNRNMQGFRVRVAHHNLISGGNVQKLCKAYRDKGFPVPRQGQCLAAIVQVKELSHILAAYQQVYAVGLISKFQIRCGLVDEGNGRNVILHFLLNLLLVLGREALAELHLQIIQGYFLKLVGYDILDGVADAKACHQQRRTAANAHNHHKQPLAVAENVPQHHLIQEPQVLPKGDVLQKNLLAPGRCLGAHQLRRHFPQLNPTGIPGHQEHQRRIHRHNPYAQGDIEHNIQVGLEGQYQAVGRPDNLGEYNASHHHADAAAQHRRTSGIEQVFSDNGSVAVAQSLQCANLGPLFFHHTGHGGNTHKSRHQEEERREHPGHTCHDVRVATHTQVACIGFPGQNIYGGLLHILQGGFCVFQLDAGVFQLLVALLQLLPGVCFALAVLFPALFQFRPALFQGDSARFQLLLLLFQFFLSLL